MSMPTAGNRPTSKRKIMWISLAGVVCMLLLSATVLWKLGHDAEASPADATVGIGQQGINPSTIVIAKGQAVIITNYDTKPHSLKADEGVMPGFTTEQAINRGDSYGYTFDTKGTFHIYDPANPVNYTATVVVK